MDKPHDISGVFLLRIMVENYSGVDTAEAELKRQGFEAVKRTKRGESTPGRVYDLTENMTFDLDDGRTVTLEQLGAMVKNGYTGRCSASWLEGATAKNTQRCLVTSSGAGHLAIWESAQGETHMPAAIAPSDFTAQLDRVAEKLREKSDANRSQMVDGDDHVSGAAKLLISYAYVPTSKTPIFPLWSISAGEAMTLQNFKTQMLPYCGIDIGPRGGERKLNPVSLWLENPNRIVAAGFQMRPDKERPIFEENGKTWLNSYKPPDLGSADGGCPDRGIDLIKQVFPVPEERAWFRQWLAYKWKHPHVPGPAVISVAGNQFGTGRGTLMTMIGKLFGENYVNEIPFNIFTGQNYQSQYNEWQFESVIGYVEESSASGEISSFRMKHNVYEYLKSVVDPASKKRKRIRKGEKSDDLVSCCSYFIATNHKNALPLPENDRRFAVLKSGNSRSDDFWCAIYRWMDHQANISAFASWLSETDLSHYSPHAIPPKTASKIDMADATKSDLDRALQIATERVQGFFVPEQIINKVATIAGTERLELPEKWRAISKTIIANLYERARSSESGRYRQIDIDGQTYRTIYFKGEVSADWQTENIRSQIIKNGNLNPVRF